MVEVKRRLLFACTPATLTFAPLHIAKDFILEKVLLFNNNSLSRLLGYCPCNEI